MAHLTHPAKPLSTSPLKLSPPLGAAMAFMGMEGSLPLFHGSQGCTAFALVMMVRHFREAIPLQTTAMNEVSTILGGMDHVEEALLNIAKRVKPKIIGLVSTALTETRGEDMEGDLKVILRKNRELDGIAVVPVSAPEFDGSLETGWSKAVTRLVELVEPMPTHDAPKIALLPGVNLTPGDIEAVKEMIEAFGLEPVVLPDLSGSLDGHVPDHYIPTTLGGCSLEQVKGLGDARLAIAIGHHMHWAADAFTRRTGVPHILLDRLCGLEAVDRLMICLSTAAGIPVPPKLRRQRAQLVDAMLDGHFTFGGRSIAVAGDPDFLWAMAKLVTDMGGHLAAAVTTMPMPHLTELPCRQVITGDFADLEDAIIDAGGADLVIGNTNARQLCQRQGSPLFRSGFPIYDRLGAAHQTTIGYAGTRNLIFQLGNILMEHGHGPAAHAG